MNDLRRVSAAVALAVADQAERDGVARRPLANPIDDVYGRMWQPVYAPTELI